MMAIKHATLYDYFIYIIDVPSLFAGPHPIPDCIAQEERQDNNGLYRRERGRDWIKTELSKLKRHQDK